jgi:hypothetical protein
MAPQLPARDAVRCDPRLVGTAYVSHVDGAAPRAKLEEELARSLGGASFGIDCECNSPETLRLLRTHHVPVRGSDDAVVGVMLVHAVVHEAPMGTARPILPPDERATGGATASS